MNRLRAPLARVDTDTAPREDVEIPTHWLKSLVSHKIMGANKKPLPHCKGIPYCRGMPGV